MTAAPQGGAHLSPTELRLAVLRNGWHPLPVAGKAPTPTDWSRYCREAPTDSEVAYWGRSHPGAVSTGLAMGAEVAVDIDVLSSPERAAAVRGLALECFGRTPFERVGRAPKTALLYRAGPGVESIHRKASDGSDDGVDVLADGCQVVGFGRHKDTGQLYAWTGEASPLDAGPEAAPVITGAQVAEFLARVETVMPLSGGGAAGGRKGGGRGSSEEIVRGASGLVVNGRERFLMNCVWRAAKALHQAKVDLTADVLATDAWELFTHPGRGADLAGGKWTKADADYKAKVTLRRVKAGKVDLGGTEDAFAEASTEPVEPTYADTATSEKEARAKLQAAVDEHFATGSGHRAVGVDAGLGKTRAGVLGVSNDIKARRIIGDKSAALYLTPRHDLNEEVAELFRTEGVSARVFRGREQPDPELAGTGKAMCLDLEVVNLAISLNKPIGRTCCKGENPKTGAPALCSLFNVCGYQRQFRDRPDVWLGAHATLFKSHAGLGDISSVTIDEGFVGSGLKIGQRPVTLDDLATPPMWSNEFQREAAGDLAAWRWKLASAMRRQTELGGLRREHLVAEGLDADICTLAHKAEWRLRELANLWPGMGRAQRAAAKTAAEGAGRVATYTGVWKAARDLLGPVSA